VVNGNTKEDFPVGSWVVDWRLGRIGKVREYVAPDEPWDMRMYVDWERPEIVRCSQEVIYAADLRPASLLEIIAVEAAT
jgi:hypothetical protein